MRVRINRSLKTKYKKRVDESPQNTEKYPNKKTANTMASIKTEFAIQISFAAAMVAACFLPFYTFHIAVLIVIFKALTNFPKGGNQEIERASIPRKNKRIARYPRNWKRRKKKRKHTWRLTKRMVKLTLITLTAMDLADNIAKHSNPENPIKTFRGLLYSLAHDPRLINKPGSDLPIRTSTMTNNKKRIREDLKYTIKSILALIQQGMKTIDNVLNVRNENMRNITKMTLKVWTYLLGAHNRRKKTRPQKPNRSCGECDICVGKGPQSLCPFCNIDLLGFKNYLKVTTEMIVTIPGDIIKSFAWTSIKYTLVKTLDTIIILLIQHEDIPLTITGLLIRMRTTLNKIITYGPKATHNRREYEATKKKVHRKKDRNRRKQHKKRPNLIWHHRHRRRESAKNMRNLNPNTRDTGEHIPQYDGTDDTDTEMERDDTPLEHVQQSTYGWQRTKATEPRWPKGIKFWSDPDRPPEDTIWENPPPGTHPKLAKDFIWANDSKEEPEDDIHIPETDFERTQIMTINVRSCYSGLKRTEARDGILEANTDIALINETWLRPGDQDLVVPGYVCHGRCDRMNNDGTKVTIHERGGGVMILAKDYITITEVEPHHVDKYIQVMSFVLDKVTVFAVYRAPKTGKEYHWKLVEFLEEKINKLGTRPYVITGDMNLGEMADKEFDLRLTPVGAETENGTQVQTIEHMWMDLISKHQITQHVEEPTCNTGKILDYVFTPDYLDIPKIRVDRHSFLPGSTDHYAVVYEIDCFFQRSREEVFRRKETKTTWRKFHEIMPSQYEIVRGMPSHKDGLTGQELLDRMSNYIIDIIKKAYEEATPEVKCKPPPRHGYLSKATIRQLRQSKRLWRTLTETHDDIYKPRIRAKLKVLNRANRWLIRKDREAWEMRRLHLAENKNMNLFKFMNAITYKAKTLGPIKSENGELKTSDKEMAESFNNFLCNLMTPSSNHNIKWDTDHEPKHRQLYIAAIPGSETLKPLENEAIINHINNLHNALINYGHIPKIGDIVDGYPLGTQARGQTGNPIVLTYKDQDTMEKVKKAAIGAGFWNNRRRRNDPNCPKGFFTAAYDTLKVITMFNDEIRDAISSSKRDSAAGPDGVKMSVFKEAEDYIVVPLKMLYNEINHTGLIPANFKTAKVIMIHKKNSKQEMGNYRPISMSNHISKLWERAFNQRIMDHLKRHNRLSKHQHGFRPKMGCHTNLMQTWEKGIDLTDIFGPKIEVWSFDLQKAFDLLDHGKSLKLCHMAGINGNVGRSLQNWLTNRRQFVQCGKSRSRNRIVNRSCIQGSVLGPTLWLIYIQSLLDRLEGKCSYYAYADDVTLVAKIDNKREIKDFNKILKILLKWGSEYSMKWGAHKTQRMAMRYHRSGAGPPPNMTFDGKNIEATDTLESLGVILHKSGIGYGHLTKIKNKIAATRTLIWKNYRIRTQEILERLYSTYIIPQINYCSQQYNTNNESHLREIETELRKFWRMSQTRVRPAKFMGLKEQLIYNDLKQLHKIVHGKSTIKFEDLFKMSEMQKRTDQQISKKGHLHAFAKYTFGRRVQKYWNLLPIETRKMGRERFKDEIKLIMMDKKYEYLRNDMLNFGRSQPIMLPPRSITSK